MTHYELYYPTKNQADQLWKAWRSRTERDDFWSVVKYFPKADLISLFLSCESIDHLSSILLWSRSRNDLLFLLENPAYETFSIPKKKGGKRIIHVPNEQLMELQKRLKYILDSYYAEVRPPSVFGFVKQFSKPSLKKTTIMGGASKHVGHKMVLNTDLKDFFPSISNDHINELFSGPAFRLPDSMVQLLKSLLLFEGRLPIGAPTSPVVSNFVAANMDLTLDSWAKSSNLVYTRYADDLSFSSSGFVDKKVLRVIEKIVQHFGFELNPKKTRWQSRRGRQTVTGIVVNDKTNATRTFRKQVRAMRHHLETEGREAAAKRHFKLDRLPTEEETNFFVNRLQGMEGFVKGAGKS